MDTYRKQKAELRKCLGARVADLSPGDIEAKSHAICKTITTMPAFALARSILLYASLGDEVRTDEFLVRLWRQKEKRVILPRVDPERQEIALYEVHTASEMWHGAYGVREPLPEVCALVPPTEVDCVLVPGRGFDERGHRLGRGKGYYDKLLSGLRPDAELIGVFFECQKADFVPDEPHDWKLHYVVTEQTVYEFER